MNKTITRTALSLLRDLMPTRTLELDESYRIAELQAARLRSLHRITDLVLPDEVITEQPRIAVQITSDLPSSGMTFWNGTNWTILLSNTEARNRQRFSLLHEYKHILDHPVRNRRQITDRQNERVADYFAACALMPKRLIKSTYCGGTQRPSELARHFGVSEQAMSYRLNQLGLTERPRRCGWPIATDHTSQLKLETVA